MSRIVKTLLLAGVGWALFFFGSWHLVLGAKISIFDQFLFTGELKAQDFILGSDGLLLRINEKYYGIAHDIRFFDSPVIQWIMLFLSISAFFWALEILIVGDD